MRKQPITSMAGDCAAFSLLIGGAIVFFGFFWPELTGWVWLASMAGPALRQGQVVLCVVASFTGIGLLRRAVWARQIAPPVCLICAAGFLALLGLETAHRAGHQPVSAAVRGTVCALGALYFGVLGGLLVRGAKRTEDEPVEADADSPGLPASVRSPAVFASLLSFAAAASVPFAAAAIAHDPPNGFRWAIAIPFAMLLSTIGAGLGYASFRQSEESSGARNVSVVATLLNLLPVLAILLVIVFRKNAYGG